MARPRAEDRPSKERLQAREWLADRLADGYAHPAGELIAAAKAYGINDRTLRRASNDLGVVRERVYDDGEGRTHLVEWTWRLP